MLEDLIESANADITLHVSKADGLMSLTILSGWEVKFTDGLQALLGLDDGLGNQWLEAGDFTGDRPVNLATTKCSHVHLDQINTTHRLLSEMILDRN